MDNNQNPFQAKEKHRLTYNSIKRNRIFRSEKKFTEVGSVHPLRQHRSSLRTQLKALIEQVPCDESLIAGCIEDLRQKLQNMKLSPKKKQCLPLEQNIIKRKQSDSTHRKQRYKTNAQQNYKKTASKSVNLVSFKQSADQRCLLDLQEMRNQIKRRKQCSGEKRIPTDNQSYRYQYGNEQKMGQSRQQSKRKVVSQSTDIKVRSNTQEVIRSDRHPSRIYHFSPKKIEEGPTAIKQNFPFRKAISQKIKKAIIDCERAAEENAANEPPNRLLNQQTAQVIDNNQKIGDLSTIVKQKQTLNFLGQSCVDIKRELSPHKIDPNSSKLLEFIKWRTNQLKNAFGCSSKQKKRKTGLDKLSKIFPKGFFV